MAGAVEVLRDRLMWLPVSSAGRSGSGGVGGRGGIPTSAVVVNVDKRFMYEPFYDDFGPLNMGLTVRFCRLLRGVLQDAALSGKLVVHACGSEGRSRANGAVLMGAYLILVLGWSANDAADLFKDHVRAFAPFRDPSCGPSMFHLHVADVLRGVERGKREGWVDVDTFDVETYSHYERVENGDFNIVVPGKFLAFSGPSGRRIHYEGFTSQVPEDYHAPFKQMGVSTVVRLNKKLYDGARFTSGGFRQVELFFPDGTCPPESILRQFLSLAESEPGVIAIHCKAGLGRTGALICAWIMKHYGWTAREVMGWIRVMRPGSIIGPQQQWLCDMERRMWREGREQGVLKSAAPQTPRGEALSPRGPPVTPRDVDSLARGLGEMRVVTSPMKSGRTGTYHPSSQVAPPRPPRESVFDRLSRAIPRTRGAGAGSTFSHPFSHTTVAGNLSPRYRGPDGAGEDPHAAGRPLSRTMTGALRFDADIARLQTEARDARLARKVPSPPPTLYATHDMRGYDPKQGETLMEAKYKNASLSPRSTVHR